MAKVLIVDDSRTSRKILKEILKVGGHEILGEASNGEEELSFIKSVSRMWLQWTLRCLI